MILCFSKMCWKCDDCSKPKASQWKCWSRNSVWKSVLVCKGQNKYNEIFVSTRIIEQIVVVFLTSTMIVWLCDKYRKFVLLLNQKQTQWNIWLRNNCWTVCLVHKAKQHNGMYVSTIIIEKLPGLKSPTYTMHLWLCKIVESCLANKTKKYNVLCFVDSEIIVHTKCLNWKIQKPSQWYVVSSRSMKFVGFRKQQQNTMCFWCYMNIWKWLLVLYA